MSLESAIEEIIQKAIQAGEFNDLQGKGKPLDLTGYFNTPEDMRMAYSLLKSNQFVPEEIDLLNEIAEIRAHLQDVSNDEERKILTSRLNERILTYRIAIERRSRP